MAQAITKAPKRGRASREGSGASGASKPGPAASGEDIAVLCGPTQDGKGLGILRQRRGQLEAGVVRPIEPGKPIHNEVVRLKPRADAPRLCDVEVEYDPSKSAGAPPLGGARPSTSVNRAAARPAGPPKVATAKYRKNWDTIWKRSRSKSTLN